MTNSTLMISDENEHGTKEHSILENFSFLIKEKRIKLNMTQNELADAIGLPRHGDRTIRRWENNETAPSLPELKLILQFPEDPPFPNPQNPKYTMIDLFAGIGGTRLGFQLHGSVSSIFSSDWDKFSQKNYHANFGEYSTVDINIINITS